MAAGLPLPRRRPWRPALMSLRSFSNLLRISAVPLITLALSAAMFGQGPLPDAPTTSVESAPAIVLTPQRPEVSHKFWDKQNRVLFIGAVISNGADFAVTRANLQNGGQELNPVVRLFGRSTAGLAANFAGESAATIALSYFFHKTNHHRLERAVSMVNIGASTGAVSYGLAHR